MLISRAINIENEIVNLDKVTRKQPQTQSACLRASLIVIGELYVLSYKNTGQLRGRSFAFRMKCTGYILWIDTDSLKKKGKYK